MTWKHFILLGLVGAMLIINGTLLYFEQVNLSVSGTGPVDRIADPLATSTVYAPDKRIANFKAFGMPEDLALETAEIAGRMYDQNERLTILLKQSADVMSQYFCPRSGVPERYSALQVLVTQSDVGGGVYERRIIDWRRTDSLEVQDWALTSQIGEVYQAVELTERRHSDSTVMGVGAILTVRETDLFARNAPFGTINWRFGGLMRNHPDLKAKITDYFALMHVLSELARREGTGICD